MTYGRLSPITGAFTKMGEFHPAPQGGGAGAPRPPMLGSLPPPGVGLPAAPAPTAPGAPGGAPAVPGAGGNANLAQAILRAQNTANDRFGFNTGGRPLDIAGGPGTLGDRGGAGAMGTHSGNTSGTNMGLSPGRNPILGAAGWLPGPIGWAARGANAGLGVTAERQKQDAMSQFTGKPAGSWGESLWGGSTGLGSTYDMGGYGVPGQGGLTGMINNLDPGVANKPGASPRTMANLAARSYAATGKIAPARETRNDRDRVERVQRERTTGRGVGPV